MREQQGKWPVIFLSFAEIKAARYDQTRLAINEKLSLILNQYASMMQDPML